MDNQQIRETLEKQLQLLSERSHNTNDLTEQSLIDLSFAMAKIAEILISY